MLTWNTLELVDAESIRVHQRESPLLRFFGWFLHFGTLCPLAAIGIWLTRHDWRRLWLLYAILVAFAAAVTLFFVFARYRYPLVPVCVLFASAGLDRAYELWRRDVAWMRELAVAVAVGTLAALFCNWPQPGLMNDEVSYITAGTGLLDDLRPEEALKVLKTAIEINPLDRGLQQPGGRGDQAESYRRGANVFRTCRGLRAEPAPASARTGRSLPAPGESRGCQRAMEKGVGT